MAVGGHLHAIAATTHGTTGDIPRTPLLLDLNTLRLLRERREVRPVGERGQQRQLLVEYHCDQTFMKLKSAVVQDERRRTWIGIVSEVMI
jgi:hypothetical protein